MKRLHHGSDVTVLENQSPRLASSPDRNIDHRSGQVVGPNYLIRKEQAKRGINCAKQSVTEIRFFPRLHRIDVRGTENINVAKPGREECVLGLSFIACERNPTSSGRVCATPA